MNEEALNQQIAERICSAFRLNGAEFHRGDAVALLDGKVVAVTKDLASALQALRAVEPDPRRGMVFEVASPVNDVIR